MTGNNEQQHLRQQLHELLEKAQANQAVLEKFQRFELKMLSSDNLSALFRVLLQNALEHFSVLDCRLVWFENATELQALIPDAIRQHYGHCLVLKNYSKEAERIFSQDDQTPILKAVNHAEREMWFPQQPAIASVAFIPLMADGILIGIYLLGSEEVNRFTADKAVDFMAHMGLIAAVCLQNTLNKERIRQLSMIDNLTRIKNRRCFDSDIQKEVARAVRSKQALSCLFIDADFFKSINDMHGHQVGDESLCALASWIKSQLRECDHLARYGGEEFVVLLPQCDEFMALQVAERIRANVEAQCLVTPSIQLKLTVSIGVCTFLMTDGSLLERDIIIKQLLKMADQAVYDAKKLGRNRVCVRTFDQYI